MWHRCNVFWGSLHYCPGGYRDSARQSLQRVFRLCLTLLFILRRSKIRRIFFIFKGVNFKAIVNVWINIILSVKELLRMSLETGNNFRDCQKKTNKPKRKQMQKEAVLLGKDCSGGRGYLIRKIPTNFYSFPASFAFCIYSTPLKNPPQSLLKNLKKFFRNLAKFSPTLSEVVHAWGFSFSEKIHRSSKKKRP